MYIEATGAKMNETAVIASPSYKAATLGHCFSFWYHMYGNDVGTLNVYQKFGNKKYFLWTMNGNRGNEWKKTEITIKNNDPYQVIFNLNEIVDDESYVCKLFKLSFGYLISRTIVSNKPLMNNGVFFFI